MAASAWPWLAFNHLIGRFVEIAVVFFCELLYCACCIVCALDISVVVTNPELHKVMLCVSCLVALCWLSEESFEIWSFVHLLFVCLLRFVFGSFCFYLLVYFLYVFGDF